MWEIAPIVDGHPYLYLDGIDVIAKEGLSLFLTFFRIAPGAQRFGILFVANAKFANLWGSCRKVCPLFCRPSSIFYWTPIIFIFYYKK